MATQDVKTFVADRIMSEGYDGLCTADCGCGVADLHPCGESFADCMLAHRWECEGCKIGELTDGCEFYEWAGGCYRTFEQASTP